MDGLIGGFTAGIGYGIGKLVKPSSTYQGGAYDKLDTNLVDGTPIHRHEIIPNSVSPYPQGQNPSIQMEIIDHYRTGSFGGRGHSGQPFTETMRNYVENGQMMEALKYGISDIRNITGTRYNDAIEQAIEYAIGLFGN